MIVPSCTLQSSPITIASESPRITAVGHTDTRSPSGDVADDDGERDG